MKGFVFALSLFAAPAFAGELCKLAVETDGEGNNVCAPDHELGASGPIAGGFQFEVKFPLPWTTTPVEAKGCFGGACPDMKPPEPVKPVKKPAPKKEPKEKSSSGNQNKKSKK